MSRVVKIFIIYYSATGHTLKLAERVLAGAQKVPGVDATIYQVAETLSEEVLTLIKAPPKADHPVIRAEELPDADGMIFGFPTRYGGAASQMKAFIDSTGALWANRSLHGKTAGVFVSTGSPGSGMEITPYTFTCHFPPLGLIFVPLGYVHKGFMNLTEITGGTPYGAGTFAGTKGNARDVSDVELEIAEKQGEEFAITTKALVLGRELIQQQNQEQNS